MYKTDVINVLNDKQYENQESHIDSLKRDGSKKLIYKQVMQMHNIQKKKKRQQKSITIKSPNTDTLSNELISPINQIKPLNKKEQANDHYNFLSNISKPNEILARNKLAFSKSPSSLKLFDEQINFQNKNSTNSNHSDSYSPSSFENLDNSASPKRTVIKKKSLFNTEKALDSKSKSSMKVTAYNNKSNKIERFKSGHVGKTKLNEGDIDLKDNSRFEKADGSKTRNDSKNIKSSILFESNNISDIINSTDINNSERSNNKKSLTSFATYIKRNNIDKIIIGI